MTWAEPSFRRLHYGKRELFLPCISVKIGFALPLKMRVLQMKEFASPGKQIIFLKSRHLFRRGLLPS